MDTALPSIDWTRLDDVLARLQPRRKRGRALLALVILGSLAAVWFLVWSTGGTRGPYVHAAYLPIILAGASLGLEAGLLTAVLATLVVGPLMPFDVAAGRSQSVVGWLYRGAFFLVIGGFIGAGFAVVRARTERMDRLRRDLAGTYSRNLRVFAGLVEHRDEQTYGHCDRVGRNAVAIGRRMGLDARALGRLYWAGLLHDLGKIGVPEAILRKPGSLTAEEFSEVQKHCEFGRTILMNVSDDYRPIADGVLAHHEKWDGTGYPAGLAGHEIPLFGRIVAVADVFEALTSHRPYRDPMERSEALGVIDDGRGSHFDPTVVKAFFAAVDAGEIGEEEEDPLATQAFVNALLSPDAIGLDLVDDGGPWRARVTN